MTRPRRLGLLGGTFDPIHVGHVAAAEAVCRTLQLDEVWLLTSHVPPHRPQPVASVHHRFAMVALAVQEQPAMRASDFELLSPGPSYTSSTLARLRTAGFPPAQLFFIVGADAFAEIATWRDYPGFLDAANFVVVSRGERPPEPDALAAPAVAARLQHAGRGFAETAPGDGTRIVLIEHSTPDVSSTAIRTRCARDESIAGMVAPAVERHIARHALYAGEDPPRRGTADEHLTANLLHEQEHL